MEDFIDFLIFSFSLSSYLSFSFFPFPLSFCSFYLTWFQSVWRCLCYLCPFCVHAFSTAHHVAMIQKMKIWVENTHGSVHRNIWDRQSIQGLTSKNRWDRYHFCHGKKNPFWLDFISNYIFPTTFMLFKCGNFMLCYQLNDCPLSIYWNVSLLRRKSLLYIFLSFNKLHTFFHEKKIWYNFPRRKKWYIFPFPWPIATRSLSCSLQQIVRPRQYCLSERQRNRVKRSKLEGIFGCVSSHSNTQNFFTLCAGNGSSDENIANSAPFHRERA